MRTKIDDAARADIIARLARDVHSVCPEAVVAYPCATLGYPRDVEILLDVFNVPENQMIAVDEATSATCMDVLRRFTRYAVVITHPTPPPEGAQVVTEEAAAQEAVASHRTG
jgi:hypothetical protein